MGSKWVLKGFIYAGVYGCRAEKSRKVYTGRRESTTKTNNGFFSDTTGVIFCVDVSAYGYIINRDFGFMCEME